MAADLLTQLVSNGLLIIIGIIDLILITRVIVKYGNICINRYEMSILGVAIAGMVFFDFSLLCGGLSLAWGIAISRAMRLLMLLSLFYIFHSSARRQRKAKDIEARILDGHQ